jgi:hypothetical protein
MLILIKEIMTTLYFSCYFLFTYHNVYFYVVIRMNHLQSKLEVLSTSEQENLAQNTPGELRPARVTVESDNIVRTPRGPDGTKGFKRR